MLKLENFRKTNLKMARFHWSRNSRDSCPTSSAQAQSVLCLLLHEVLKYVPHCIITGANANMSDMSVSVECINH